MKLALQPLTGGLGAEVKDLTLAGDMPRAAVAEVRAALLEHLVLVFRNQDLEPAEQAALGRRFGPLHVHPFVQGLDEQPEIIRIVKLPEETTAWGEGWHSDISFEAEPSMGSILVAKEVPPFGGDTLFANMVLAYETLDQATKDRIAGLKALHSSGEARHYTERYQGMRPRDSKARGHVHPVVRTHSETGRKLLFVSPVFTRRIEGLAEDESRALLARLCAHATRPELTCRVRWEPGMAVFWDNRAVLHYAVTDYFEARGNLGHRRVMHRVTIQGDRPV